LFIEKKKNDEGKGKEEKKKIGNSTKSEM